MKSLLDSVHDLGPRFMNLPNQKPLVMVCPFFLKLSFTADE